MKGEKTIIKLLILNIVLTLILFSGMFVYMMNQNYVRYLEYLELKVATDSHDSTIDYTRNLVKVLLFGVNNQGYQEWLQMPTEQKYNLMNKTIDLDYIKELYRDSQ